MPYTVGAQGNRIFYRVSGDSGPHVVLVQGLALSGSFWFRVPETLVGQAHNPQRVIVPDNRGTGGSDLPIRPWWMRHMADDIVAVLDAEGVQSAVVVGISMGGMVAQHVALRHPGRVDGLVLMATAPGLPHARLPSLAVLSILLRRQLLRSKSNIEMLARLLLPERERHRTPELLSQWPRLLQAEAAGRWASLCQLGAVLSHSTGLRLSAIGCPTVVMTGTEDVLVPPENSVFMARRIPGATLEELQGVGHGIPLLDADATSRAVARVRDAAASHTPAGAAVGSEASRRAGLRLVPS